MENQRRSVDAVQRVNGNNDVMAQVRPASTAVHLGHGVVAGRHVTIFRYWPLYRQKHGVGLGVGEENPTLVQDDFEAAIKQGQIAPSAPIGAGLLVVP